MKDYEDDVKYFLRHDPCPVCGSSDNVVVYFNERLQAETYFCQTPKCTYRLSDADVAKKKTMYQEREGLKIIPLKKRGISEDTCKKYNIKVDLESGEYVFPYYDINGRLVACKYRTLDKQFYWEGDTKSIHFFGSNTGKHGKSLLITEGELDAASASQMTSFGMVVSVPNGAQSAAKFVKSHLQWVEEFEKVYICFDGDEAGKLATEETMNLIKIGKAYRVVLRRKDANEYLLENDAERFKKDVFDARPLVFDGVVGKDTLYDWVFNTLSGRVTTYEKIGNTGIRNLDRLFHLRTGELTTLFADTSVGKSSVLRWITSNLIYQGIKTMVIATEEPPKVWTLKVAGMLLGKSIYSSVPDDVAVKVADFMKENFVVANYTGTVSVDNLGTVVEYAVRQDDVKVVIFDNITAATADDPNTVTIISQMMSKMNALAKQFDIHIIVVSHTKRDKEVKGDNPPGIQNAYGSGNIERFSDNIISLGRDVANNSNVTRISVLKQRANGERGEVKVNYDHNTFTFYEENKSENDRRGERFFGEVRQQPREAGTHEEPEVTANPSQVEDLRDSDTHDLQPRLQDSGESRHDIRGSEGVSSEGVAHEDETRPLRTEANNPNPSRVSKSYSSPPSPNNFRKMATKERLRFCTRTGERSHSGSPERVD